VAERVSAELPPVSAIADVLALWGLDGWLTPPLDPVVAPPAPVAGRARTVRVEHAPAGSGPGLGPLQELLSDDLSGRVVLVAGARDVPAAVFGELLAAAAKGQGAVGVAVDGRVRDVPDLEGLGLPVLAAGRCVVGPNGAAHAVAVGGPVVVGGVGVDDGDVVVLDATGAVRLAPEHADAVIDAARRYAAAEAAVAETLAAGAPLRSAYAQKAAVVAELRSQPAPGALEPFTESRR